MRAPRCAAARLMFALRKVLIRVRGLWSCCFRCCGGRSWNRFTHASRGSCLHVPARAHTHKNSESCSTHANRFANRRIRARDSIRANAGRLARTARSYPSRVTRSERMRVASRARLRGAPPYPSHLRPRPSSQPRRFGPLSRGQDAPGGACQRGWAGPSLTGWNVVRDERYGTREAIELEKL